MQYHRATVADVGVLAEFNRQLIQDEGHRKRMMLPELEDRMRQWLQHEYSAILFEEPVPVAYALYRQDPEAIYLRQFFVQRQHRRQGIGRRAMQILLTEVWPPGWRITLEVLVHNRRGYAFWQSLGFQDYALTMELLPQENAAR
jgi:GNAT superfamily N-acetyltransferase